MMSDYEIEQAIERSEEQDLAWWESLADLFCSHEETIALNEWGTKHGCISCGKEVPTDLYVMVEEDREIEKKGQS